MPDDNPRVALLRARLEPLYQQIARVIVGQRELVDRLILGLLTGGHILIEGVPGLAKTLAVRTLAQGLHLIFSRIQFTPDLLPADVIGTQIYNPRSGDFTVKQGPVFANFVLADEINRAPAKVQSALLEAMQEKQVTLGDHTHHLPEPFCVLATQNPIEQEGTYPLPEAQLDRFLFLIKVDYPTDAEEEQIMRVGTAESLPKVNPVLNADDILSLQSVVRRVPVSDKVFQFAKRITRASRPHTAEAADFSSKWLTWGAGPRASMNLILAAKAHAVLQGRHHVAADDVVAVAPPILRHRLIINFTAQSEGVTVDDVIKRLIKTAAKEFAG